MNHAPTHKRCSSCHEVLPLESFAKKRSSRAPRCKPCHNAYVREHYRQHRDERVKEIHARNKEVTESRLVLVRALTEQLSCEHCGKHVWLTPLNHAARMQVGEERFKAAASALQWRCRSNPTHSGTTAATPATWLRALIGSLTSIEHTFAELTDAVRVTPAELDAALEELCELGLVFSPLPGWVQPAARTTRVSPSLASAIRAE